MTIPPYTDESGSDGVVRTAAANLNATYFRLEQATPETAAGSTQPATPVALEMKANQRAPRTAFALIAGRSHSGEDKGIIGASGTTRGAIRPSMPC
jgi:hypothetical protein